MNFGPEHDALVQAMARLHAHKAEVRRGQDDLVAHAREQAATMPRAVHVAAGWPDAGILGHRRHRTLIVERRRLDQIGTDHDGRTRARD